MDINDGDSARPLYRTPAAIGKSKAELANLLALVTLLAFGVAFLAAWSVLGDSAFAVKLETGELPPGAEAATAKTAVWISGGAVFAGLASIVAAASIRGTRFVTGIFVLTIITAPLYLPASLLLYGLAF